MGGAIAYYASRIFLTNQEFLVQEGKVPARTLSLAISREIDGGIARRSRHQQLRIGHCTLQPGSRRPM